MRKRILAIVMCAALLVPVLGLAQASAADETALRFNDDGEFKILQVADLQDSHMLDLRVRRFLQALVDPEDPAMKPDLVVLTGDNIQGATTGVTAFSQKSRDEATAEAIDKYMSIFERAGVPVAVVFGNHDTEGTLYIGFGTDKEKQLAIYQSYENCLMVKQDMSYENKALSGVGNYNLPILASDGGDKVAYNIWLFDAFDSGSSSPYDGVHDDVLGWYEWKSEKLKAENDGQWVPSVIFQHVIVPEIYDAMEAIGRKVDTSVPKSSGDYIWEDPCPNETNTNQFGVIKGRDVKAMFVGHDHNNNFLVPYQGIDIYCTGSTSFGDRGLQVFFSYNRAHDAMARMVTLHEDAPDNIETETLFYSDYVEAGLIKEMQRDEPYTVGEALGLFFDTLLVAVLDSFDKFLIWTKLV